MGIFPNINHFGGPPWPWKASHHDERSLRSSEVAAETAEAAAKAAPGATALATTRIA